MFSCPPKARILAAQEPNFRAQHFRGSSGVSYRRITGGHALIFKSQIRSEKYRLDAEDEELSETLRRANDAIEDTNEVEKKLKAIKRTLE